MHLRTTSRKLLVLACLVALAVPVAATAGSAANGKRATDNGRLFFSTDSGGNLVSFREDRILSARRDRVDFTSVKRITGLPAGVSLRGIDFRPATGDLYGVGSDNVVYRVNPTTAIAIAEGPAFTPGLSGTSFGFDFNPTVDKIRVTSDANQNVRLDPDPGTLLATDGNLNPGDPTVVGSAYTNSSFTATKPTATVLYAIDAGTNQLLVQAPPNDGTLTMPKALGIDVQSEAGFDIAGSANTGYLTTASGSGTVLYRVDLATGKATMIGKVGDGRALIGLAAWQDTQ